MPRALYDDQWVVLPQNRTLMRNRYIPTHTTYIGEHLLWAAVINRALLDFNKIVEDRVKILPRSILYHYTRELYSWLTDLDSTHIGSFRFAADAAKFSASTVRNIRNRVAKDALLLGL